MAPAGKGGSDDWAIGIRGAVWDGGAVHQAHGETQLSHRSCLSRVVRPSGMGDAVAAAGSDEPERAVEAGHTGDSDVVGAVRASALRPHYDAALRPGQSTPARDEQGGERGRSASGTEQDRGGGRAGVATGAARLLHA